MRQAGLVLTPDIQPTRAVRFDRHRRRAKLREYYEECEEKYEKELNEMGLAFVKARV